MNVDEHLGITSGLAQNVIWASLIRQVIYPWLEIWKSNV